jgi:hypothetical protein
MQRLLGRQSLALFFFPRCGASFASGQGPCHSLHWLMRLWSLLGNPPTLAEFGDDHAALRQSSQSVTVLCTLYDYQKWPF